MGWGRPPPPPTNSSKDLLDILMDAAEDVNAEVKLTRENIKAFVLDIFTAGSDTTATSVEWALALALNHPDCMEKMWCRKGFSTNVL